MLAEELTCHFVGIVVDKVAEVCETLRGAASAETAAE